MKLIPIAEWAKRNGIDRMEAVNLARRHKSKIGAVLKKVTVNRWLIDSSMTAKKQKILTENGKIIHRWLVE